jgi:hypothetical protein
LNQQVPFARARLSESAFENDRGLESIGIVFGRAIPYRQPGEAYSSLAQDLFRSTWRRTSVSVARNPLSERVQDVPVKVSPVAAANSRANWSASPKQAVLTQVLESP